MEQRSQQWFIQRLGMITASRFSAVIGGHRGRESYLQELLADRSAVAAGNADARVREQDTEARSLEWGRRMEPAACAAYELQTGVDVEPLGFVVLPGRMVGGSGDGRVVPRGCIEIKCPWRTHNHVKTLTNGMPAIHIPQVQGMIWILGADYCDFISFDERFVAQPLFVQRVVRSDEYIGMLNRKCAEMETAIEAGGFPVVQTARHGLF